MSDQPAPRARRSASDISKLIEEKFTPLGNLTRQDSLSRLAKPESDSLRLPPELEDYLPLDLWRKLSNVNPRRGLYNNALDRMQSLLYTISTYLPANLVQEKLRNPEFESANGKLLKGCLLFTDVSGFTALSERLAVLGPKGAEHLTGVINQYFTTMIDILTRSNGILLKFAGDATLVYFPEQAGGIHAQWAARTGLRMMRAMQGFSSLTTPLGTMAITMKIGLSAGSFLAASIGSKKRMEYALIGTTVSQTLQAEGCTSPGQIVSNHTAAELLSSRYEMVEVKPGFFLLNGGEDGVLDEYEIQKTDKRKGRGSAVQWDTTPEEIAAEIKSTLRQINVLTPYLASELVDRIVAHADQRQLQSEYRPTTVMFCNFTGPETLLEAWGEAGVQRVTRILSEYFTAVNEVIRRFGGIVSRIDPYSQGTKLLALFGAPVAHEDDAHRAISAALEMNNALSKLNQDWAQDFSRHLPAGSKTNLMEHRIGITLGDTFAGQAGSSTRREYTVMGDEVNLAARLMSAARPGQILISQPVFEVTDASYVTRKLPAVRVKGKKDLIEIWQVDGPREDTLLNRIHSRPPLIGRASELDRGWKIIERARDAKGCVLILAGQAGIGKSHLADVLLKKSLEDGWRVHAVQCRSYLAKESFSSWKGLLRSLANITSIDHPLKQKEKVENLGAQLNLNTKQIAALTEMMNLHETRSASDFMDKSGKWNAEELLASVKRGEYSRKSKNSRELKKLAETDGAHQTLNEKTIQQWQTALAAVLSSLSAEKPLIIFFEDAQWVDAESKTCLEILGRELSDKSLVFLLALRQQEADRKKIGERIELTPFTKVETRSMVAEILTAGLVDIIHDQSGGSPLFVEEISRWIKRANNIDENRLREILQTSDILQSLVLSRLESLPEGQREVARLASIIGAEFRNSEVKALLPDTVDPATLHEYLNDLKDAGLITFSGFGVDRQYTFAQPIFRDILYTSLPFERRSELHGLMARHLGQLPARRQQKNKIMNFLEDEADANPIQNAEKLAYHYEMAGQWSAAAQQLLDAAETLNPFEKGRIESLYNRALTLLEHYPPERIDSAVKLQKTLAYVGLGNIAIQRDDIAAGAAAFESAIAAAPAENVPSDLTAGLVACLSLLLPSQGKVESAEKQLTRIIDQRSKPDDWKLHGISAWLTWRAGRDASSQIASCRACLPEIETGESQRVRALMDDLSGDWAKAAETYQMLGEVNAAALAWVQLGDQFLKQGKPTEADGQYELAANVWQESEFCGMALIHYRRAELAWMARQNKKALTLLEEGITLLEKSAPELQAEPRAWIQKALTRVNKKQYGSWAYLQWQPFSDLFRIRLCFPLFRETLRKPHDA